MHLEEHEYACGSRTEPCESCGCRIQIRLKYTHVCKNGSNATHSNNINVDDYMHMFDGDNDNDDDNDNDNDNDGDNDNVNGPITYRNINNVKCPICNIEVNGIDAIDAHMYASHGC